MIRKVIGLDLGSFHLSIFQKNKGLVLQEPSVVAIDKNTNEIVAYGSIALKMYGKTPSTIDIVYPIQKGVVADFELADKLVNYYLKKLKIRSFIRPTVIVINRPIGITPVEENAFLEIGERFSSRNVVFVDSVKAAALGAGLDMSRPKATMLVNMGADRTEFVILAANKIVKSKSLAFGGNFLDKRIISYLKRHYRILIGKESARILKEDGLSFTTERNCSVSGKDMTNDLPRTIQVTSSELREAVQEEIYYLMDSIKEELEDIHPEMAGDIAKSGIVLVGGSSSIEGINQLISNELDVPVQVSRDNHRALIDGIGIMLDNIKQLKEK